MYLVKCAYCETTFETASEGELVCKNCGGVNSLDNIIRKTSGNYFRQAAEQDYDGVQKKRTIHKPQSRLEKVKIVQGDQKLVKGLLGRLVLVVLIVFAFLLLSLWFR